MAITRMEHFLVLTDHIEKTRDFYCNALGVTVGFRPVDTFGGYWLYSNNVPCIHIGEWASYTAHAQRTGIPVTTRGNGTGALDHIAFNADDYDESVERLNRHGIASSLNVVPEARLRQLFVKDPNGIQIEINIFGK